MLRIATHGADGNDRRQDEPTNTPNPAPTDGGPDYLDPFELLPADAALTWTERDR